MWKISDVRHLVKVRLFLNNLQASFMSAIQFSYESSSLPTNFSAEARWGDLLSPLEDQAGHSATIVQVSSVQSAP